MTGRSPNLLEPGSKLQDRYKIVSLIGQGGLGSVYLCEDLRLPGTQWALKELRVSGSQDHKKAEEAFLREANFLASLRHECMPMIVDVFSVNQCQYLVMEFIDGENLAERIASDGAPSTVQALKWTLELAQVLDYLHSQEKPIIFRDLKPENVMITKEGRLKVIDFGLARHFESGKSHDTQASGTVGYTPPEQWESAEQSDPRSDIFALGATLYFFLSGKPPSPIYGKSNLEEFGPRFAPELHQFVSRCMQLSPDDRFGSAAELISELLRCEKAQTELTPFASQDSERDRLRSPLKTDQRVLKMLAAGALLFALGILLPFFTKNSPQAPKPLTSLLVDDLRETADQKVLIRKMLSEGHFNEALAQLDGLLALHPQDAEAHILKNNAYAKISGAPLYNIPVLTSLKGKEREGFNALFGWALAQSDINQDRESGKPMVYLDIKDDKSESELLLELVESIVKDPQVSILLGPWTSQQALMVAPLVNDGGLSLVTPVSSDPRVLPSGPNVFCVSDTDINKSRVLADHFYAMGCRKAAVFADRSRYVSRTVSGLFSERFEELGGDIVLQDDYPRKNLDFASRIDMAQKRDADCVFLSEYRMTPVISFCKSMNKEEWNVPLACQVAGFSDEFVLRGGDDVDGVFLTSTYVPEFFNPVQTAFQNRFRNTFGKREATHREAQVYDSLRLAVDALDAVGEDRTKLRDYLTDVGRVGAPYSGVSGVFAPSRRLNARPAYVVQVKDGGFQLTAP